ncbi:MAG: DUF6481 family protein [Caulobacteraceae bacterium]|jgi:hypothetical protein
MKQNTNPGFADRLAAQAEAKKAMLARFQPKPTVVAENHVDRTTRKEQEREAIRRQRVEDKEKHRAERAASLEAARQSAENIEQEALEAKRVERRERKATMRSDAQSRRAARLAMYARS